MGVKLHCAICKRPKMYSPMSVTLTQNHSTWGISDLYVQSFDAVPIVLCQEISSFCFSLSESFVIAN